MCLPYDPNKSHWTKTAIECYKLDGDCSKCSIPKLISEKCQMKITIVALLKIYGEPMALYVPSGYSEEEFYELVKCDLLMGFTHQQIAQKYNITDNQLHSYIQNNNLQLKEIGFKRMRDK